MRHLRIALYLIRWILCLGHGAVWLGYQCLFFFSKPGTRKLFPVVVLGIVLYLLADIHAYATAFNEGFYRDSEVGSFGYVFVYGALALACLLLSAAYLLASRFLSMLLSVFPPIRRPLPPMFPMLAPKRIDQPVPVTIGVPPLPR